MKRALILAFKVAFVGVLVYFVGRSLTARELLDRLHALLHGWPWLVLAQGFILTMLLLTFYRWKLLLEAQEIHYTFREATAIGFVAFFFSQIIPGSTGGDVVKAYYVAVDHPERRAAGITTVFLDRVVGLLDLVVLAGVAILINWHQILEDPGLRWTAIAVGAILSGGLCGAAIFFNERFRSSRWVRALLSRLPFLDVLGKVQSAIYIYKFHPRLIVVAILLSCLVQILVIATAICYAMALSLDIDYLTLFFIVPLANLASSIPIAPGGLGQLEGAYKGLFHLFGFDKDSGLVLGILQRVNWYLWSVVGWVFYLKRRGRVNLARKLAAEGEGGLNPGADIPPGGPGGPLLDSSGPLPADR